jgi:hypothetical protein
MSAKGTDAGEPPEAHSAKTAVPDGEGFRLQVFNPGVIAAGNTRDVGVQVAQNTVDQHLGSVATDAGGISFPGRQNDRLAQSDNNHEIDPLWVDRAAAAYGDRLDDAGRKQLGDALNAASSGDLISLAKLSAANGMDANARQAFTDAMITDAGITVKFDENSMTLTPDKHGGTGIRVAQMSDGQTTSAEAVRVGPDGNVTEHLPLKELGREVDRLTRRVEGTAQRLWSEK